MFEPLREALRQAVENFRSELHAEDGDSETARVHRTLSREFVRAEHRLARLAADWTEAVDEARREGEGAEACRRREEMALAIGDRETARVAGEFRGRHLRRREILEEKARVLLLELEDRREEVEGMRRRSRELLGESEAAPPGVAEAGAGE